MHGIRLCSGEANKIVIDFLALVVSSIIVRQQLLHMHVTLLCCWLLVVVQNRCSSYRSAEEQTWQHAYLPAGPSCRLASISERE